jgi:hypothetical protein
MPAASAAIRPRPHSPRPALRTAESRNPEPDAKTRYFERPTLQATVALPPEQKLSEKITTNVADNLSRTLSERLGVGVKVTAEPPPLDRHWSEILGAPCDCSTAEARAAYRMCHAAAMAESRRRSTSSNAPSTSAAESMRCRNVDCTRNAIRAHRQTRLHRPHEAFP